MDIQAVLFDCDGTMFDTEIISQRMWVEEAERNHYTLPEGFFKEITGGGNIKKFFDDPSFTPVYEGLHKKRMDPSFWSLVQYDCLNKPGLIPLFTYLEQNNYKVGICSSSGLEYVKCLCSRVSVPLHYDTIVCGDMVKNKKPDPEIFLKGAKLLNVAPENCLVIEDSKNGILAATRANMHNCFIFDTIEPDEEMKPLIEYQVEDMNKVIDLLKASKN